jgi:hypothetical protein
MGKHMISLVVCLHSLEEGQLMRGFEGLPQDVQGHQDHLRGGLRFLQEVEGVLARIAKVEDVPEGPQMIRLHLLILRV